MRWITELSGNWITIWGVVITIVGMAVAGFGTFKTTEDSEARTRQAEEKADTQAADLALKSDQLLTLTAQLAAKSDDIAKLSQENARLTREHAAFVTGADSYFYLHPRAFGSADASAAIEHIGPNPVRETELMVFDISAQIPDLVAKRASAYDMSRRQYRARLDVSDPRSAKQKLFSYPFVTAPDKDAYAYIVQFGGLSFTLRQIVQFVKVNGDWKQGYTVERVTESESGARQFVLLHQYFDEDFPSTGDVIVRRRAAASVQ